MATKQRRAKQVKERDSRKITVQVPEELYFQVKQWAKDEIRTVSQQAQMFMMVGLQYISQANEECDEHEPEEKEPCIGFKIDREEDYDDGDE